MELVCLIEVWRVSFPPTKGAKFAARFSWADVLNESAEFNLTLELIKYAWFDVFAKRKGERLSFIPHNEQFYFYTLLNVLVHYRT